MAHGSKKKSLKIEEAKWDSLPPDILTDIVLRLPIKSVITCSSVCKSWNSIIKSPNFIFTHLKHTIHSYNHNDTNLLLLRKAKDYKEIYSLHLDSETCDEYTRFDFPSHGLCANGVFHIVGTCNGLICLNNFYNLFVWNPCIRKYLTLPTLFSDRGFSAYSGFGFDSKTNDHKVVRIATLLDEQNQLGQLEVNVYSLATGKWKRKMCFANVSAVPRRWVLSKGDPLQAFVNGALHWIALHNDELRKFILAFDLGDENVREIMLPEELLIDREIMLRRDFLNDNSCGLTVSVFGESLAVYRRMIRDPCIDIWVMKEYGVLDSWTKVFTVDLQVEVGENFDFPSKEPKEVGFRKSGEIVIEMEQGKLVSLDPEHKEIKDLSLGVHGYGYTFVDPYVESLVLLDNSEGAVSY